MASIFGFGFILPFCLYFVNRFFKFLSIALRFARDRPSHYSSLGSADIDVVDVYIKVEGKVDIAKM